MTVQTTGFGKFDVICVNDTHFKLQDVNNRSVVFTCRNDLSDLPKHWQARIAK